MTPQPAAEERSAAIDVLRGIAMATVVARHVSWRMLTPAALASPGGGFTAGVYLASDFGVPLFVALSALSLAWRYSEPFGGVQRYVGFLSRRAVRLLPAYVLWSLVSLAARDWSLLASPTGVAQALFYGTADVQLYYVPMLFELYLLWPLLRPLLVRRSLAGALVVLAAGAATADVAWRGVVHPWWTPLMYFATSVAVGAGMLRFVPGARARGGEPFASAPRPPALALAVVLFVVTALTLENCVGRFLALAPGSTSRGAIYMLTTLFAREQAVYAAALTVALAIVAGTMARTRLGAVLASLGRVSYGVFLIHLLVASTFVYRPLRVDALAAAGGWPATIGLLAAWLITLVTSHAVAMLLSGRRGLRWMVGGG